MSNTARVESPVAHQNAMEAADLLCQLRLVGWLLARLDENFEDREIHRCRDLGHLIGKLTEQPLDVISEVISEKCE